MADLFDYAREARDTGMALAADAQEAEVPGWGDRAYAAIVRVAQRQATVHVDDIAREFPEQPSHFNVWGSVWMRAIRDGVIERTGEYRASTQGKKHAHVYALYASRIFGRGSL